MRFVLDTLIPLFILFCYEEKVGGILGMPSSSSHLNHTPSISPNT